MSCPADDFFRTILNCPSDNFLLSVGRFVFRSIWRTEPYPFVRRTILNCPSDNFLLSFGRFVFRSVWRTELYSMFHSHFYLPQAAMSCPADDFFRTILNCLSDNFLLSVGRFVFRSIWRTEPYPFVRWTILNCPSDNFLLSVGQFVFRSLWRTELFSLFHSPFYLPQAAMSCPADDFSRTIKLSPRARG